MVKAICSILFVILGCSMVHGQSATVNSTLNDIKNFQSASITTASRAFNGLFGEVYGHYFRSQSSLRIARQSFFTTIERFPIYTLTADTRKNLVTLSSSLFTNYMDPTIDYLQKDSMLRFYNFAKDENTPIERTLKVIAPQLAEISTAVANMTNDNCVRRENINRRLPQEYNAIITAINDCTRNLSILYRPTINEFTRLHFQALPTITRMNSDAQNCANNGANRESCVVNFLKTYCDDKANESCKTGPTILAVKTQAETMVNDAQTKYDECLKLAEAKIPATTPFIANLSKCSDSTREDSNDEVVIEEHESVNTVN